MSLKRLIFAHSNQIAMEEVKRGDIVQFRGQAEDDLSAFLVLAVYSDGRVAVQEVSSRILKVERVVEASRLKVLF